MNKTELIEQLERISGNPEVVVMENGKWLPALDVCATGEDRNSISIYAFHKSVINYLGPVP